MKKTIEQRAIDLLGLTVTDKIQGTTGIVTSVDFDLYGCIQVVLTPKNSDKDNPKSGWLDINRLEILDKKRAMEHPDFANKYKSFGEVNGPADKPMK